MSVGYDEYKAASLWQDAVIRQLQIIGEAVKKVSPQTLQRRPEIPCCRIAGMRDVLIHDYMGVDLEAVWQVTQHELGDLRAAVEDLVRAQSTMLPIPRPGAGCRGSVLS